MDTVFAVISSLILAYLFLISTNMLITARQEMKKPTTDYYLMARRASEFRYGVFWTVVTGASLAVFFIFMVLLAA